MNKSMLRMGNRIGVWMYRRLGGRLASGSKDAHVLMLTVPGRRSGMPRSTCMRYLDFEGGYLVWGTGSGSPTDPDWFRNLRKATTAQVQVGNKHLTATPRILRGTERDAVWRDVILAQVPEVEKYARKAGRTIPVAVLVPART
jgi:deazaflavin-dependent oxidoreductase (nitroreductase family)